MKLKYVFLVVILLLIQGCEQNVNSSDPDYKKLKKRYTKIDLRLLKAHKSAQRWFNDAYENSLSSYHLGSLYLKDIKDYEKAWYWYRTSWNIYPAFQTAQALGSVHEKLKEKEKALKWYKKSWERKVLDFEDNDGFILKTQLKYHTESFISIANNIAHLYMTQFNNDEKALKWYKKALEKGSEEALPNLATLYLKRGDKVKAAAYTISSLGNIPTVRLKYSKKSTLNSLKEQFKLDDETIKKGYELQLTLEGLPKRYRGNLFE